MDSEIDNKKLHDKYDNYYDMFKSVLDRGCTINFESVWEDGMSFSCSHKVPEHTSKILQDYDFKRFFLSDIVMCSGNPRLEVEHDALWASLHLRDDKIHLITALTESEHSYDSFEFDEEVRKEMLDKFALICKSHEVTEEPLTKRDLTELCFFEDEPVKFTADGDDFIDDYYNGLVFFVKGEAYLLKGDQLKDYFKYALQHMDKLSLYSEVQEIYFYGDSYKVVGSIDVDITSNLKSSKFTNQFRLESNSNLD